MERAQGGGVYSPAFPSLTSQYLLPMAHAEAQVTQFLEGTGQREPREAQRAMSGPIHLKGYGGDKSITCILIGAMLGTSAVVGTAFVFSN